MVRHGESRPRAADADVGALQDHARHQGFHGAEINKLQNKVGRTFWQDESYDHWVRDSEELMRIVL
jgi:hypothetical protein